MLKGMRNNSFVCLDEVTGKMEEMNYVIYNPNIDALPARVSLLYKTIKASTGLELTDDQLAHLTAYDSQHLRGFVDDLSEIIRQYRSSK